MAVTSVIFVGIKGSVLAIDRATGTTVWQAPLKGSDFVNVVLHDGDLFAATKGRLYRLDPATGTIQWSNELPGFGFGLMTIASASHGSVVAIEKKRRNDAAAAAAAT